MLLLKWIKTWVSPVLTSSSHLYYDFVTVFFSWRVLIFFFFFALMSILPMVILKYLRFIVTSHWRDCFEYQHCYIENGGGENKGKENRATSCSELYIGKMAVPWHC